MFRLFKNIKQKLFSQGNLRKYSLYAIGEIILVVIGILIALQINNWNENKKLEAISENYLNQLLADLDADKKYYENYIALLDSNLTAYANYKKIYTEPDLNIARVIEQINHLLYTYHHL